MILQGSIRYGFWILEDDAYGELRYGDTSISALKAMDGADKVVYLGSFSQVLFPGLRIGYSLVPEQLEDSFICIQARKWGPVSSLDQLVVQKFIEGKGLESALELARGAIESLMKALTGALMEKLPKAQFLMPEGGIYLWLRLPGLDGWDAAQRLENKGFL